MPRLEIYLFGLPQVKLDGSLINFKSHKALGLIAYLAIVNKRLSREVIASIFWPNDDQKIASGSLRTTLWRINKSGLKEWFLADRESMRINYSNNLYIDAIHFLNLVEKSSNHGHSPRVSCNHCISILKEIVDIYNNGFMQSYYINDSSIYEEWQLFQQERMRFLFSSAIGRLVNAYGSRGDLNNALMYAHHWLLIDPYHDEANRVLMQLYIDAGQRESALRHYDEYVSILRRDLKISPDEAITSIYHQIKSGISKSKFSINGSSEGIIFHVNYSSITSPKESIQEPSIETLSNYTDHLADIIHRYGGNTLSIKLDSISALFLNGDPLNCALIIQIDHKRGLKSYTTFHEPSIFINSIENETYGSPLNDPRYAQILDLSQFAWEGQILLTPQVLARYDLPKGAQVVDLGTHSITNSADPIHILGLNYRPNITNDIHPAQSSLGYPHNLPLQTTPFIGREYELSLIGSIIQSPINPLISLVGPGGIGKTRLAVQVGSLHATRFADGVYYIPIDTKIKPDQFIEQLSDALHFRLSAQENPEDQVINYLNGKQILLIIDNFENMIDGSSILIDLIQHLPDIKIILTSREHINLKMEWIYEIQGLSYPMIDHDIEEDVLNFSACQLFIQSARRILPEFTPEADQKSSIAQICRSVGGSPLAIELAAAWLRSQTCFEINEHINSNLDFLSGSIEDIPDRHRSLRVVFDQSWKLLSEGEQRTVRRLSIFRGSFQARVANQIANTSFQNLASCVDKSMLRHYLDGRYEMPETIRFFAEEKLNDLPNEKEIVIKEFCDYYGTFSQQCEADLLGHNQLIAIDKVRQELKNIAHAWQLVLQTSNYQALNQFINTLYFYHDIKCSYHDGSEYFSNALETIKQDSDPEYEILKVRLQVRLGYYLFSLGYYEEGLKYLEEILPIAQNNNLRNETVFTLLQLGDVYRKIGEFDLAMEYISESIRICEGKDVILDPFLDFSYAQALLQLGALHSTNNDLDQAKSTFQKSIDAFERAGNLWWVARAYGSLSYVTGRLEDYEESKRLRERNLAISKKTGDKRGVAVALNNLAGILEKLGEKERIIELLSESLQISQSIGDRRFASIVMQNLAQAHIDINADFFKAEEYYLDSIDTFRAIGDKRGSVYALHNYACALLDQSDLPNARYYCRESIRASQKINDTSILLFVLSSVSRLFLELGDYEKTAELCGFLNGHQEIDESTMEKINQVAKELQTKMPSKEYIKAFELGKKKDIPYFTDNV